MMFEDGVVESRSRGGGCESDVLDAQHQNQLKPVSKTECQMEKGEVSMFSGLAGSTGGWPEVPLEVGRKYRSSPPVVPVVHNFVLFLGWATRSSPNPRDFGEIPEKWRNTSGDLCPVHQICGSKSQITSQIKRSAPSNFRAIIGIFEKFQENLRVGCVSNPWKP